MYLQATGETNQVGTDTEARTLASRYADGRGYEVQHGEDRGGDEGQRGDLVERETLPGDKDSGTRNDEALD